MVSTLLGRIWSANNGKCPIHIMFPHHFLGTFSSLVSTSEILGLCQDEIFWPHQCNLWKLLWGNEKSINCIYSLVTSLVEFSFFQLLHSSLCESKGVFLLHVIIRILVVLKCLWAACMCRTLGQICVCECVCLCEWVSECILSMEDRALRVNISSLEFTPFPSALLKTCHPFNIMYV